MTLSGRCRPRPSSTVSAAARSRRTKCSTRSPSESPPLMPRSMRCRRSASNVRGSMRGRWPMYRRGRPAARRLAGADQGCLRGRGRPHDLGLADPRRPHLDPLRLSRRGDRGGGRHRLREIEHARIPGRRQHLQRGLRPDAQSLGHAALGRRLLRRRRRRGGDRHGLYRARAPTTPARSAIPPRSAASSAFVQARASCRRVRAPCPIRSCPSSGRSPAPSPILVSRSTA